MSDQQSRQNALLGCQRDAFSVPADIAYFNTANLAPQLHSVRTAGEAALERRARPWAISAADWFSDVEQLRTLYSQIIGADADGFALIPATSYGFGVAARNLPLAQSQRVLVLADEYPSGIYTWRAAIRAVGADIVTVDRAPGQSWTEAILDVLDERIAVVSVPNVHWTDGALIDLVAISARCRQLGARLVIDGSQSIGALPLDVSALQPDFVISVGYKWLLGPFGVGYLYVAPEHRNGEPLEQNWIVREDSEDFARLVDYRDGYQPGARRFDVGQRTKFELLPMAVAALQQLLDWQIPRVAATLAEITAAITEAAADVGLPSTPTDQRGPHLLGLGLPAPARSTIVATLAAVNCFAAVRGGSLRIAPHLHVTAADIERLREGLAAALR